MEGAALIRGIVFDFDLTLVDSALGICANLNALAEEKGLRPLSISEVRPTIGRALVDAMRSFWGDGPVEDEWLPRYRQLFVERNYAGVAPFPGTREALETLRSRSISLAIATNRLSPRGIVTAAGLADLCPVIVGIENFAPKPDPAILLEAMRLIGTAPSESVYVGDTDIDMRTALSGGITGIGVTTGNHDAEALRAAGASYVIKNLGELPALVEAL